MKYLEPLISLLCEHLEIRDDDLEEDTALSDLGLDSMDETDFTMAVEDHFGIEVTDSDIAKALTLGDVAGMIGERIKRESCYE